MSQQKKEETEQVVDFTAVRAQKIDEKRRKAERIFFQQLLSVYCVTEDEQMRPIEIIEVSEEGCSFQVPYENMATPWPTSDANLKVRLYFSQDTYLPLVLKIEHSRVCIDKNGRNTRYGCRIDKTLSSYPAYQQFVKFLKLYSEHAHQDKGKTSLFYL